MIASWIHSSAGLRPDAGRGRAGAARSRGADGGSARRHTRACGAPTPSPRRRAGWPPAARIEGCAQQVRRAGRPPDGGFYAGLVGRTGATGALRARPGPGGRRPPPRRPPSSAGSWRPSCCRWRLTATRSGASATRWPRATSSAPPSTWTRRTPGAGREVLRLEAEMGGSPGRSCPAAPSSRPSPRSRPTRPGGSPAGRTSGPGCRTTPTARSAELHGTHFDIPEPARRIEAMIAPTSGGGIYYTGPSEDWTQAGPDVVVPSRTASTSSRPGRRSPPSTTRACPAITCRSQPGGTTETDRLNRWQRTAVLGLRARRGLGAVRRAADGGAGLPR